MLRMGYEASRLRRSVTGTEGGILSSNFEARRRAGFIVALFASLLTLPLIFPHSATSEVPKELISESVANSDGKGMRSLQDEWAEVLEAVAATSTTTTAVTTTTTVAPLTTPAPQPRRPQVTMVPTTTVTTEPPPPPTSQGGLASWYELEGAQSGVCAHRNLPFGTTVTVTAVKTGATVACVVGDRGPFAGNLIIDLFRDDFATIAPLGAGVVSVHLTW